jgi:UDP-GlcNAc:undecaprenyl-phosphate/decaprenyl-phosphate GlcNAc-1-phosphate transferase
MITLLADVPGRTLVQTFTADEVLSPYIYVFYAAFIVSFLFTPIMRAVAMHYGIIDRPDLMRKIHREPVAYLGGAAVFLGWIFGLAMSRLVYLHRVGGGGNEHVQVQFSIVVGAALIVVIGLWDDIKSVRPNIKIIGQVLAAVLLLSQGVGTHAAEPMLSVIGERLHLYEHGVTAQGGAYFSPLVIYICSSCMVIALIVGCCNATNLMDGLDGLCGGVTGIIAAGFLFLAVHIAMYNGTSTIPMDALRIVLGLALLGGVLGFIPYNFNPASIFMGDTGSMFLGYAIAIQIILMAEQQPRWFLAGMVMFALPILDTSLAFVRRYVNNRPFFSADKHHIHHQLMARGLTVKRTVLVLYAMAIGFTLLGGAVAVMRTRYAGAVYLVIFGSIIVAAYKMGMVHERPRVAEAKHLDETDTVQPAIEIEPSQVLEVPDVKKPVKPPVIPPGTWEEPAA